MWWRRTLTALTRMLFEGYVRATWLHRCATEKQVEKFSEGWEPPKTDALLTGLQSAKLYEGDWLADVKNASWKSMCSYAHTGGRQVQRWQTSESVEPNYSDAEIVEVLGYANLFASLASIELVVLSGNEETLQQLSKFVGTFLPVGA